MTNTVKHELRFLEVIRSLNCEPEFKSDVGRKEKKPDLQFCMPNFLQEPLF